MEFLETQEDLYFVDTKVSGDNKIQVEIDSFDGVSLDDCALLNRFIESKIDRETEDYELEVSSAGLSEPFKVLKQYEKNLDEEVEVLVRDGLKHKGILSDVNEENFTLLVEKTIKAEGAKRKSVIQEPIIFNYTDIKTTQLIIRFK